MDRHGHLRSRPMETTARGEISRHAKLAALCGLVAFVIFALPDPWGLVVTKLPVVMPLGGIALYQSRSAFRAIAGDPTIRGKGLAFVGLAMGGLLFIGPLIIVLGVTYDSVFARR